MISESGRQDLVDRMKLIIRELKTLPDEKTMAELGYWKSLRESVVGEYGSLAQFYDSEIGNDFLSANTVEFPSDEQEEGITQMVENPRLLIRDRAGAGKTVLPVKAKLALEQLALDGQKVNGLVVCPNFVVSSWQAKLREYLVDEPNVLTINSGNRKTAIEDFEQGIRDGTLDWTLVSYDALFRTVPLGDRDSASFVHPENVIKGENMTLADRLVGQLIGSDNPFMFVPDEVHNSKNPGALRSKAVRKLALPADYFYPMSGDIFPDNLEDLGELASLLDNGNYPTAQHFNRAYDKNPRLIRLFLRRFSKEPVISTEDLPGMPPITRNPPTVFSLSGMERMVYEAIPNFREFSPGSKMALLRLAATDVRTLLPEYHNGKPLGRELSAFFDEHPDLEEMIRRPEYDPTVYQELDRLVERAVSRGEKIVVWSKLREGITKQLEERYSHHGSARIDGTVESDPKGGRYSERDRIRLDFQTNPDTRVLIATIDSLREGQDLHAANNEATILMDWSPGPNNQRTGRIHRRGQQKAVESNVLHAAGTLNAGVYIREGNKREGIELVDKGVELSDDQKDVLQRNKPVTQQPNVAPYLTSSGNLVRIMSGNMIGHGSQSNLDFLQVGENGLLYAQAYNHLWNSTFSAHTARLIVGIIQDIEEKDGVQLEKIVDSGSGPATVSRILKRPSLCLDINPHQLRIGKEECGQLGFDIETIVGDAENLEGVDTNAYDLSVMSLVLHYGNYENGGRKRMVLEANRVIGNEGYSIITLPESIIQGDGIGMLEEGLDELGLVPIESRTGVVEAIDSVKKDYRVYVAVCKKAHDNSQAVYNDDRYNGLFVLNPDFNYRQFGKESGNGDVPGPGNQSESREVCGLFRYVDNGSIVGKKEEDVKVKKEKRRNGPNELLDLFGRFMK